MYLEQCFHRYNSLGIFKQYLHCALTNSGITVRRGQKTTLYIMLVGDCVRPQFIAISWLAQGVVPYTHTLRREPGRRKAVEGQMRVMVFLA